MQDNLENSNYVRTRFIFARQGVAGISELESYAEGNLAVVWATCVRQVSGELPEKKRHVVLQKVGVGADVTILMSELKSMLMQKEKITVFSSEMVIVLYCRIIRSSKVAPVHAMKARMVVQVFLYPFLNSTLDGDERSTAHPIRFACEGGTVGGAHRTMILCECNCVGDTDKRTRTHTHTLMVREQGDFFS
jgi:hypothetical protein